MTTTFLPTGHDRWAALRSVPLWRYHLRLQPWTLQLCTLAVAAGWSWRSGLDTGFDRTVLAIMTTAGLTASMDDEAASTVASTPTSRLVRRLPPVAIAVAVSGLGWMAMTMTGPPIEGGSDRLSGGGLLLEWCAIGASQLALGAALADRGRFRGSLGAPLILSLVWVVLAALPRLQVLMWPVTDHALRWWIVLAASVGAAVAMSHDPARRHLRMIPRNHSGGVWWGGGHRR